MIQPTQKSRKLARKVIKQATTNVIVKFGQTNGRQSLHVNDTEAKDKTRASTTIYTDAEWDAHPLNKANRPRKRPDADPYIDGTVGASVETPDAEPAEEAA